MGGDKEVHKECERTARAGVGGGRRRGASSVGGQHSWAHRVRELGEKRFGNR